MDCDPFRNAFLTFIFFKCGAKLTLFSIYLSHMMTIFRLRRKIVIISPLFAIVFVFNFGRLQRLQKYNFLRGREDNFAAHAIFLEKKIYNVILNSAILTLYFQAGKVEKSKSRVGRGRIFHFSKSRKVKKCITSERDVLTF